MSHEQLLFPKHIHIPKSNFLHLDEVIDIRPFHLSSVTVKAVPATLEKVLILKPIQSVGGAGQKTGRIKRKLLRLRAPRFGPVHHLFNLRIDLLLFFRSHDER